MQAGLQGMWSWGLSSAADNHFASCDEAYWKTPSLAANRELLEQYTTTWDQLFFCQVTFETPCHYVTHNAACDQLPAEAQQKCYDLFTMDGLTVLDVVALKVYAGVHDGPPKVSAEWLSLYNRTMSPGGRGYAFTEKLEALGLPVMAAMSSVNPVGALGDWRAVQFGEGRGLLHQRRCLAERKPRGTVQCAGHPGDLQPFRLL